MKDIGKKHFKNNKQQANLWIAFIVCFPFSCIALYILILSYYPIESLIESGTLSHGSEILFLLPLVFLVLTIQVRIYKKLVKLNLLLRARYRR